MRGSPVFLVLFLSGLTVIGQTPTGETPPLRIGPGVTAPRLKHKAEPEYSAYARADHIEGMVVLQLVVGPNGRPAHIEVLSPLGYGLDEKAIEAINKWIFDPATKDGMPVPVRATIEVNFRLVGVPFDEKYERHRTAFNLALQKLRGKSPDPKNTAVDSMVELARQDFPAALYVVGMWQIKGEQVAQDVEAGQIKVQKAAGKNFGPAMYQLALRMINDPAASPKAWGRIRLASTLGSAEAQYFLGDRYERGDGVARSADQAKNHFRLCAAKGESLCQYRLARLMFDSPNRPDYEYEQALAWFELAAGQGVAEAGAVVEREKPNLTPAQDKAISILARQFSGSAQ